MIDNANYNCDEALAKLLLLSAKMNNDPSFKNNKINYEIDNIDRQDLINIADNRADDVDLREELFNILDAMFDLINRDRPRYNVVIEMVRKHLGDDESKEDELIAKYEEIYNSWQKSKDKFDQILNKTWAKKQEKSQDRKVRTKIGQGIRNL